MQQKTILNAVEKHKSFVYSEARWSFVGDSRVFRVCTATRQLPAMRNRGGASPVGQWEESTDEFLSSVPCHMGEATELDGSGSVLTKFSIDEATSI